MCKVIRKGLILRGGDIKAKAGKTDAVIYEDWVERHLVAGTPSAKALG